MSTCVKRGSRREAAPSALIPPRAYELTVSALAAFVARRFSQGLVVAWLVTFLVFVLLRVGPGDPARLLVGGLASQESVDRLSTEMGLHEPIGRQYTRYLSRLLHGDAGRSYVRPASDLGMAGMRENSGGRADVTTLIAERLPLTLQLAALAAFIAVSIALPLGLWAGLRPGRWPDGLATLVSATLASLPNFWLAGVLGLVVSVQLGWLPAVGYQGPSYTVLPALVLAVDLVSVLVRSLALSLAAARREAFVRIAPIRGLSAQRVLWGHAMKAASVPLLNLLGMQLSGLLGGVVVVEYVFDYPGIGHLMIEAVLQRDFPVVQAIAVWTAALFLVINLLVDLLGAWLDPRLAAS